MLVLGLRLTATVNVLRGTVNLSSLGAIAAASLGTMLGAAIPNQAAAIQAAQLTGFLTSFLLSGYIFPVANIPQPLRFLSNLVPMSYYLEVIRDAFLRGSGWSGVWYAPIALALLSAVFFWRAWSVMKDMQVKA
jgi:ABC-2 type transport system permease protein